MRLKTLSQSKNIYYHGTRATSLPFILKNGLVWMPDNDRITGNDPEHGMIYLSKSIDSAVRYVQMANGCSGEGCIIVVNVSNLDDAAMDENHLKDLILSHIPTDKNRRPTQNINLHQIANQVLLDLKKHNSSINLDLNLLVQAVREAIHYTHVDTTMGRAALHKASALLKLPTFGDDIRVKGPIKFNGPTAIIGALAIVRDPQNHKNRRFIKHGEVPNEVFDELPECDCGIDDYEPTE